jgi:hypothetical protein
MGYVVSIRLLGLDNMKEKTDRQKPDLKRVYVAGKLNADAVGYLYNVHKMMNTAQILNEAGYATYVPALDLLMGIAFGYTKYEEYFNNSQPWLKAADAVFLVEGWETSKGTIREINTAFENNVPVFDRLDEMWQHFKGVPGGSVVGLTYDAEGNVVGRIKERNLPDYMDKHEVHN